MNIELCYFRIDKQIEIKNQKTPDGEIIYNKDFSFSREYKIYEENKVIKILQKSNYIDNFFSLNNTTNIKNITAIIGKNESGKSALINHIMKILYYEKYKKFNVIFVFKKENKLEFILPKGYLVEENEIRKEILYYENEEQLTQIINNYCKEFSTIYFSNIVNFRNKISLSKENKNNFFNLSLNDKFLNEISNCYQENKNENDLDASKFLNILDSKIKNNRIKVNINFLCKSNDTLDFPNAYIKMNLFFFNKERENQNDFFNIYNSNNSEEDNAMSMIYYAMYSMINELYLSIIPNSSEVKDYKEAFLELKQKIRNLKVKNEYDKRFSKFENYCYIVEKLEELKKYDNSIELKLEKNCSKNFEYEPVIIFRRNSFKYLDYLFASNKCDDKNDEYEKDVFDLFKIAFSGISSGEQGKLDLYSEFYYIRNKIKTKSILVILDEPELYFHPEWQRNLIHIFIKYFNKYFDDKKIQIIFTSNSPYVLSDLPKDNVILLGANSMFDNTFANNIYSILKNEYFMNYTMGEFARKKLEYVIEKINNSKDMNEKNYYECKNIIEMVGENLLRNKLLEMLDEKYKKNEE